MSAFASALAAVFRDPNVAESATRIPAGGGASGAVRVIRYRPDEIEGWGGSSVVVDTYRLEIRIAEAADLGVGDLIHYAGGPSYEITAPPSRDDLRLVWTAEAREL